MSTRLKTRRKNSQRRPIGSEIYNVWRRGLDYVTTTGSHYQSTPQEEFLDHIDDDEARAIVRRRLIPADKLQIKDEIGKGTTFMYISDIISHIRFLPTFEILYLVSFLRVYVATNRLRFTRIKMCY